MNIIFLVLNFISKSYSIQYKLIDFVLLLWSIINPMLSIVLSFNVINKCNVGFNNKLDIIIILLLLLLQWINKIKILNMLVGNAQFYLFLYRFHIHVSNILCHM